MSSFATRGLDRDSLFMMAELHFDEALVPTRVTVRNLSAGGMMVERDMRVRRGQRVALDLSAIGEVTGVVVWVRSPRFGIAFERDIDPELVRAPMLGSAAKLRALPPPHREPATAKLRLV